eukprot:TRINITY_DN9183_c0_g1_i3.p1 TRINITY_DN9183_c0_g1~~TRINITY_DN9183_c0_g1_i3.p1  ORF type:complete len:506 (+),score=99.52 TRINITY_DN9183_c0_g1_i3:75-1520(+)
MDPGAESLGDRLGALERELAQTRAQHNAQLEEERRRHECALLEQAAQSQAQIDALTEKLAQSERELREAQAEHARVTRHLREELRQCSARSRSPHDGSEPRAVVVDGRLRELRSALACLEDDFRRPGPRAANSRWQPASPAAPCPDCHNPQTIFCAATGRPHDSAGGVRKGSAGRDQPAAEAASLGQAPGASACHSAPDTHRDPHAGRSPAERVPLPLPRPGSPPPDDTGCPAQVPTGSRSPRLNCRSEGRKITSNAKSGHLRRVVRAAFEPDEDEFHAKVSAIFQHFDGDQDAKWGFSDAAQAQRVTAGVELSWGDWVGICQCFRVDPRSGLSERQVAAMYADPSVFGASVDEDYDALQRAPPVGADSEPREAPGGRAAAPLIRRGSARRSRSPAAARGQQGPQRDPLRTSAAPAAGSERAQERERVGAAAAERLFAAAKARQDPAPPVAAASVARSASPSCWPCAPRRLLRKQHPGPSR